MLTRTAWLLALLGDWTMLAVTDCAVRPFSTATFCATAFMDVVELLVE